MKQGRCRSLLSRIDLVAGGNKSASAGRKTQTIVSFHSTASARFAKQFAQCTFHLIAALSNWPRIMEWARTKKVGRLRNGRPSCGSICHCWVGLVVWFLCVFVPHKTISDEEEKRQKALKLRNSQNCFLYSAIIFIISVRFVNVTFSNFISLNFLQLNFF